MRETLAGEKILIGPSSFSEADKRPMEMLLATGAEIVSNGYKRKLTKPELAEFLSKGITGIIAGLETLNRELMSGSKLKAISRCGSGMSNVDLEAARDLGITICSTPDAPVNSVAELTLGTLLSMIRMMPDMNKDLHEGKWAKRIGVQLEGKEVAIIGFGRIGRRFAELLAPFKTNILVVDPFLKGLSGGFLKVSLEEALTRADIISIHCSGRSIMLSDKEFNMVKKGVFLLNAARGNVVDEAALTRALDDGRVAGAWLDVFEEEPYKGALIRYPQVILTPHIGSYTVECRKRMEMESVSNLIMALKDKR